MHVFVSDDQERLEMVYARLHHLPPVGYQVDLPNWNFTIDAVRGPLVEKAWELALEEVPVDQILKKLNDEDGFKMSSRGKLGGKPMHRRTLYNILKDPFYAGYIRAGERLCRGLHKPLVSKDGFLKVQALLGKRRKNWN